MEDNRSKQMELACDLAHIATREMKGISDDEMWFTDENEELRYKENVQDLFNEFYDSFDTHISHMFPEQRAYIIDGSLKYDNIDELIPTANEFNKERFKTLAEEQGTVYSLEVFQQQFNALEINIDTDDLLID